MWVLRDLGTLLDGRGACFVHRHVGFKRFCVEETQLLCTSMRVLCDFMHLGIDSCAHACWFYAILCIGNRFLCASMLVLSECMD